VAYYTSEIHDRVLRDLEHERDAALAAGDQARAAEIEDRGEALQDLAHRQLAGRANLENVLKPLNHDLPRIAREVNVSKIVEEPESPMPDVRYIDVTPALVKLLPPAKAHDGA